MSKLLNTAIIEELIERYRGVANLVLVDYLGLTAPEMCELRSRLRARDIRLEVVKNRLARLAFAKTDLPAEIDDLLAGPTAVASSAGDFIAVAKELVEFAGKNECFRIKGGVAEGAPVGLEQVRALAALGSRKALVARAVGAMAAPMSSFAGVTSGLLRSLLGVLDARKSKLEGQ